MKQKSQKFASLKADQHIKTITLELALKLFDYPKFIGTHEGKELTIKEGLDLIFNLVRKYFLFQRK